MRSTFRVFIAESNDPTNIYQGQMPGAAAREVLRAGGVRATYRAAVNTKMLERAIEEAKGVDYKVFHLQCHADDTKILLTDKTYIEWDTAVNMFGDLATPDRIFVNSACKGGHASVAEAFEKTEHRFGHILGPTGDATFYDLCIAWAILYNEMANADTTGEMDIVQVLHRSVRKINHAIDAGRFAYMKWQSVVESYEIYYGIEGEIV